MDADTQMVTLKSAKRAVFGTLLLYGGAAVLIAMCPPVFPYIAVLVAVTWFTPRSVVGWLVTAAVGGGMMWYLAQPGEHARWTGNEAARYTNNIGIGTSIRALVNNDE